MELEIKNRSFHVISGRLRMELYGLKNNPETGQKFEEFFSAIDGIQLIKTNIITGKILLHFDENMIPLNELCYLISNFEETLIRQVFGIPVLNEENDEMHDESEADISQYVAAASEIPQSNAFMTKRQQVVGSMLGYVPKSKWARAPDENPVPLPLGSLCNRFRCVRNKAIIIRSFYSCQTSNTLLHSSCFVGWNRILFYKEKTEELIEKKSNG